MTETLVAFLVSAASFIYFLIDYLQEYQFYKENGWDFNRNNPKQSGKYYKGDMVGEMSNKERITFYIPFFMTLTLLFALLTGMELISIII